MSLTIPPSRVICTTASPVQSKPNISNLRPARCPTALPYHTVSSATTPSLGAHGSLNPSNPLASPTTSRPAVSNTGDVLGNDEATIKLPFLVGIALLGRFGKGVEPLRMFGLPRETEERDETELRDEEEREDEETEDVRDGVTVRDGRRGSTGCSPPIA